MLFNEILKGLREERGLTQKNIADACKVSPTCICQLETGSRSPTGSTLLSLADFFNCSIDYLLGREDDFGNITIHTEKPAPLPPDTQELLIIGPRVRVPEGAPKKRLKTRFLAVFYYFFVVFCSVFNHFPQFSPNQKPPFPPTWAGFSFIDCPFNLDRRAGDSYLSAFPAALPPWQRSLPISSNAEKAARGFPFSFYHIRKPVGLPRFYPSAFLPAALAPSFQRRRVFLL